MFAARKNRRLRVYIFGLILVFLAIFCSQSQEIKTSTFSLTGFPEEAEMRAIQERIWNEGPVTLEPFIAPLQSNTPALTNLSKQQLLDQFIEITTKDSPMDVQSAQELMPSFTIEGLEELRLIEADQYTIEDYAREAVEKLGPIPSFNVFEIGQVIPITLNDVEIPAGQHIVNGECDRPALLGLGSDGQCVPYSRIGRLPGIDPVSGEPNPNIQWIFIARRYKIKLENDPFFEDVAIIGHHKETGFTAFFQMLDEDNGKDATRVPSPMESISETPPGAQTAKDFWLSPTNTAGIRCNRCHDSNPFIHTPYINQVKLTPEENTPIVPSDKKGSYSFIGSQGFSGWEKPLHFKPTGNICTECHRIGIQNSINQFLNWSTGMSIPEGLSPTYQNYPKSHWMPPNAEATIEEWNSLYKQSIEQLISCREIPNQEVCQPQEIQ